METVFQIIAVCLLAAGVTSVLKKHTPELSLLLALAAAIAILAVLADIFGTAIDFSRSLMQTEGLTQELFVPLFKTAAIALVSRIAGDLCRDTGESALASLVDAAGAMGAIVVSLPLFEAVWEILQSLI